MTSETAMFIHKLQVRIDDEVIDLDKRSESFPTYRDEYKILRGRIIGLEKANEIINTLVEQSKHWDEAVSATDNMTPKNCGYYDEE